MENQDTVLAALSAARDEAISALTVSLDEGDEVKAKEARCNVRLLTVALRLRLYAGVACLLLGLLCVPQQAAAYSCKYVTGGPSVLGQSVGVGYSCKYVTVCEGGQCKTVWVCQ